MRKLYIKTMQLTYGPIELGENDDTPIIELQDIDPFGKITYMTTTEYLLELIKAIRMPR